MKKEEWLKKQKIHKDKSYQIALDKGFVVDRKTFDNWINPNYFDRRYNPTEQQILEQELFCTCKKLFNLGIKEPREHKDFILLKKKLMHLKQYEQLMQKLTA